MTKPIKNIQLFNDLCEIENVLIERGWCKNAMVNPVDGRVCVVGAAIIVGERGEDPGTNVVWNALMATNLKISQRGIDISNALHSVMGCSITLFNDDPDTTFNDVLAKLREAQEALIK